MKIFYYGHFRSHTNAENWIASAISRNGHHCHRVDKEFCDWQRFENVVREERPDAVLFTKIPEVPVGLFSNFRDWFSGHILWWTFDWMRHESNSWYLPMARMSDLCFMTDGTDPEGFYASRGINRVELHQAADYQHRPIDRVEVTADVAFMGSLYTNRRVKLHEVLESLGAAYRYYGSGGTAQEVWGEDFARVCCGAKIIVGDNFVNDVPGYWSDRVYLSLGCGGFFLTAYVPGLEKEFENGKHLVWWNDFDELRGLIAYYLPKPKERERIAKAGHRLVMEKHTWDARMRVFNEELVKL
jgi:hypothetical protein